MEQGLGDGGRPPPDGGIAASPPSIATLLAGWQRSGDPHCFAVLAVAVRPVVESVALKVLRNRHIADRSAIDDVLSLVLDHLRRLPGASGDDRRVARFRDGDPAIANGLAFIRVLARTRSLDVARGHRRRWRRMAPLSLADDMQNRRVDWNSADGQQAQDDIHQRLAAAIDRLDPRLRTVVELLLAGTSQADIARTLGVCEGTVSRDRGRAIARLRGLLAED